MSVDTVAVSQRKKTRFPAKETGLRFFHLCVTCRLDLLNQNDEAEVDDAPANLECHDRGSRVGKLIILDASDSIFSPVPAQFRPQCKIRTPAIVHAKSQLI